MKIEDEINSIDCKLMAIKLEVNSHYCSTYSSPLAKDLVDIYHSLKKEKNKLLKRKQRLDKLEKINER